MEEIVVNVASTVEALLSDVKALLDGRIENVLAFDGRDLVIHTQLQTLFNWKQQDQLRRTIYETVLNHLIAAEKLSPGGFIRCAELLVDRSAVEPTSNGYVPTTSELRSLVEDHSKQGGKLVGSMVNEALGLVGFKGRILIEKTSSATPSVTKVNGYTFQFNHVFPFNVSISRPRVVCVDGYVESVSEVHHLFEEASSMKEACFFFARGMSDDVKHTLKVNYDRGSLRIIPIIVKFDLEGMNSLNDVSVVSGAELVSNLKGDLISAIKLHEAPIVDQVTTFNDQVVIVNSKTTTNVSVHVQRLREKRAAETVEDVVNLLSKRIKCLSPNHAVIRLPDSKAFVLQSQAADYALRAVKSAVDYGVRNGRLVATEIAAQVHADRCARTLREIGAYVST